MDKNCTKICINFQLKFIKNIYFWKNKRKTLSYFYSLGHFGPASTRAAQGLLTRARASAPGSAAAASPRAPAHPRAQAATWAWAGNPALRPFPPGLRRWPSHAWPLILDRRWSAQLGASKPRPAAPPPENPRPFLFLLSSPTAMVAKTKGARGHLVT